jgi:uncharacterized membrane protein YvbJ
MADRYCTNCGQELGQDDKFCTNCGTPMREAGTAAPQPPQQTQQPRKGLTVGRVLILVFVVPVLVVYSRTSHKSDSRKFVSRFLNRSLL